MTSSAGTWSGAPTSYAYQWNRDATPIAGSINATRTLTSADVGHLLSCTVTATNAGGSTAATSANSASVIAAAVPVPANSVAPAVTGSTTRGAVLSSTTGTWTNSPSGYGYQWRRDGVDISGATASTYTILFGDVGRSLTCRVFATNAGGTAGATSNANVGAASIGSIDAKGWSGQWSVAGTLPAYSTGAREYAPDATPDYLPMTRQGYDSTATAVSITENLIVMRRVRQAWTGATTGAGAGTHVLGDGNTVSLSSYAYSTDTPPAGVTNNSTETSPLPIAAWQIRNRRVTGNSLYVELVAFHGSGAAGKPVAAVTATATDGTTTTAPLVLTGPAILSSSTDKAPVIGYYGTIDVSALADGACSYNAKVYPRIGGAASVLDSATGTLDARGFTPQGFYKAAGSSGVFKSKGVNPVYAYIDATSGSDTVVDANGQTAGVTKVSTTAATASATPFATLQSVIHALKAATNITGGFTDGCIIRCKAGTYGLTQTNSGTYQSGGELIVEADPSASAGSVTLTLTSIDLRQSWITYRNIAIVRSGAGQLKALAGGRTAVVNCTLDNASQASAFYLTTPISINGLTVTNIGISTLTVSNGVRLMRGVTAGTPNGTAFSIDPYTVTGCLFGNPSMNFGGLDPSGGVIAFSAFMGYSGTGMFSPEFASGGFPQVTGFAFVQNICEFTAAASNPMMRVSADSPPTPASITHWVEWNNTYAGGGDYGRHNAGYDEKVGTLRTHKHWSQVGNICVCPYTKHDWFIGTSGGASAAEAPTHIGGWSVMYQVGGRGNLFQFAQSAGAAINGDRSPADHGLSAQVSTSATVRLDPQYAGGATTLGKARDAAGAGGSGGVPTDYTLASGSRCKGVNPSAVLPFDFGGNARNVAGDTCGAWS